jgi:hypothetical protein
MIRICLIRDKDGEPTTGTCNDAECAIGQEITLYGLLDSNGGPIDVTGRLEEYLG